LESYNKTADADALNVAVFGRFKAGKSSFLNHLFGSSILPAGVIPVTSVVTDVRFDEREHATIEYLDGRCEDVPVHDIGGFVSERANPDNEKGVSTVRVGLPSLAGYRGLHFIDTPGLESVLTHNTQVAENWMPNVGLAVVAIGVDPPLSEHDVALIEALYRQTPEVVLLLTKIDLVSGNELAEIVSFIEQQLRKHLAHAPRIVPYSIRPGFEHLRDEFRDSVLTPRLGHLAEEKARLLHRKMQTILAECESYLRLALGAATRRSDERRLLKEAILGEDSTMDDAKRQLRQIAQQANSEAFETLMKDVAKLQPAEEARLLSAFDSEVLKWRAMNLMQLTEAYEQWLDHSLTEVLARFSGANRQTLSAPLVTGAKRLHRVLNSVRSQVAQRASGLLGAPVQLSEIETEASLPRPPQIHIGSTFEHHFELVWFLIPMTILRAFIERRLRRRLPYQVFKNLSRLASQWTEALTAELHRIERRLESELDEFVRTIEAVLSRTEQEEPGIRADLDLLDQIRRSI
jgi:GTP-binding protein EngB required for normal cell division